MYPAIYVILCVGKKNWQFFYFPLQLSKLHFYFISVLDDKVIILLNLAEFPQI